MNRPIAISLSPNIFPKDVFLAIKKLVLPWKYNESTSVHVLEKWFKTFFSSTYAFSYTSGRAGLYEILKGYGIGKNDEVLLQAFTCVALPNAIVAVGAKPVYVDIAENLTLDVTDLEKKITLRTKAIIMQHTFGIPSAVVAISALTRKHGIPLIEDCAHGIGVMAAGKKLGQFGDVAFFSFGRDKAFSSVFGGLVITNNTALGEKLQKAYAHITYPSHGWTAQQLFHPIVFAVILPLYDFFSLGKILLILFQKLHMLSFPVTKSEKKGHYSSEDVKRLPGALASLAVVQLERLPLFNKKREHIAALYIEALENYIKDMPSTLSLPYLRFPFLSEKRDMLIKNLRRQHIYLGNWYTNVIDPVGTDFIQIGYTMGMCPHAEYAAKRIINLPTFPTLSDEEVASVIKYLKAYV